jgi:DNA-binding transcriptional ArsR family regulator
MTALRNYETAFNALGDPTRRTIFEKLANGPLSVVFIAEGLDVSRPAVSQHLKVLREAKLITMEQKGTRSIYCINQEGLLAIHEYLDKFWSLALINFRKVAEEAEKEKSKSSYGSNQ